jgi:UDP-GlcNAc:undecaprenyl-phosphate GlcNAc-1-phosphate transferase
MNALMELLQDYLPFAGTAFVATVFATPLAMRVAHGLGVLDVPDRQLKPHARPTPYLGGTAICLGWCITLAYAIGFGGGQDAGGYDPWLLVPVILGGLAMAALGLSDDVWNVSPRMRLIVGAAIVSAVVLTTGIGTQIVDATVRAASEWAPWLPGIVPPMVSVPLSILISIFIVLGACNSSNVIDGLDGLATGVTAIISVGFFLLAAHLAAWGYSETQDPVRLVLAAAMCGATLGFLPWNFNPARIFMGDAGSVLLGYNCGILILLFAENGILRWVIGALMIFALPVFDMALAMFRRWRAGRSIFEGDRSHFYDQLVQRGFSVRQTVLVCYALTLLYALFGLLLTWVRESQPVIRTRYAALLYVVVVAVTALAAWGFGLATPEERRPRPRSEDVK